RDGPMLGVELDHAVALGIAHLIREHGRAALPLRRAPKHLDQAGAVENVVAERKRDALPPDELAPDDERLRESFGLRLHGVLDATHNLYAGAEGALKRR